MNPVNKRLLSVTIAVLAALSLGACRGGDVDAVRVGDRSLSRMEFSQLTVGIVDDENPLALFAPGDQSRNLASQVVMTFAQAEYLESQGIVVDEATRSTVLDQLERNVVLSTVEPRVLDLIVIGEWLPTQGPLLQTEQAALEISDIFRNDVEVDSRLGVWIPDQTAVVPRGPVDESLGSFDFG